MKSRYFLGLFLIVGSVCALVWQLQSTRILSYNMLPPDMSVHGAQVDESK